MSVKSLFPPAPIAEARQIAETIAQKGAGQPMRRLDVFQILGKSADSGPSRNLVSSSSGFGLTTGGYKAEILSLTDLGKRLGIDRDESAMVDAVLGVDIFGKFFETYKEKALPADVAGKSFLASAGIPLDRVAACWELALMNGRDAGLLREMAGAERVLTREHAIELLGGEREAGTASASTRTAQDDGKGGSKGKPTGRSTPSININLEIHLPSDATPEVYEAIFSSMRKHLVDVE